MSHRLLFRAIPPAFRYQPIARTRHIAFGASYPRFMSITTPKLHQFVAYCPDKTDEECLARRLGVREQHLANAKILSDKGILKLGGALLSPESILEGKDRKMVGSMVVFEGESIEQIKELIENDIYYTAGVWDPAAIVIKPFVQAHL